MECSICLNNWDASLHVPRLLQCGHTFCESCLVLMLEQKGEVMCSLCMQVFAFKKPAEIQALIKNFMLLQAVEPPSSSTRPQETPEVMRASIMVEIKEENPDVAPRPLEEQKRGGDQPPVQQEKVAPKPAKVERPKPRAPKLVVMQRCTLHNMLLHSWNPATGAVLCTQCIQEANRGPKSDSFPVLPAVISEIRKRILACREMLKLRRLEVKKVANYLKDLGQTAPLAAKEQLAFQLSNLQELIGNVHKLLADKMSGQIDRQSSMLKGLKGEIDKAKQEFSNHEIVLNDINAHADKEIVYFTDLLQEVIKKVNTYDIDRVFQLDNLGIAVQTNENMFNQVGSFISSSVLIKPCHPTVNGAEVYPSLVVKQDEENWICLKCYQAMHASTIFCQQCQRFRDVSTLPNVYYNPYKVSRWELNYLGQRRDLEKKMVVERDEQDQDGPHVWYFISAQWLSEWKMFVLNKESKELAPRMSPNREIGVLPPGPVSNMKLLREGDNNPRDFRVKAGLQKLVDYRGVNERVWNLFILLYGGGPCIWGKSYDIYDNAKPLVKKYEKILEEERQLGRVTSSKNYTPRHKGPKVRRLSGGQDGAVRGFEPKMKSSKTMVNMDGLLPPAGSEKPSSQRNIFSNRQQRSNLRSAPKQRGQSAGPEEPGLRVMKMQKQRSKMLPGGKSPPVRKKSSQGIQRSQFMAEQRNSDEFDEANLQEEEMGEAKRATTLKKFVGLMRNIFNN